MTEGRLQMYGAPWCPDCQRAKQFLNEQRVAYDWYDIDQDEKARVYVQQINEGKQIIPTILFPDGSILVEPSNTELAAKLGIQTRAGRAYYDLIIVGAGPAGLTAGIYAAREGVRTLIIERGGIGGQAGVTQEIENYPGFPEPISGSDLAERLRHQAERFGVEILPAQQVTGLRQVDDSGAIRVQTRDEYRSAAVVLATGSTYRRLGVPGEEDFIGAGVHFCATCDGPFYQGQDIVVVGGGNSGFQEGLFLSRFAKSVTILEMTPEVRASMALQDKVANREDMQVFTQSSVTEFRGGTRLESILVEDIASGKTREMRPGAVFVFIGLLPNTKFLKGIVDLDQYGFIDTKPNLETSVPGIFAAGDCRSGSTKQVVSAAGEGATVALMVREYMERRGERAVMEPAVTPS